jgi:CRP-like cAMP-binding protein
MLPKNMTEFEQLLKSSFGLVQSEDLLIISSLFKSESIKKGDFFLKQGKRCERLSFIQEGILRIYKETEERDVTQWIATKGFFLTDVSSFIFEIPARHQIQAITDIELLTINRKDYYKIGQLIPGWYMFEKRFLAQYFVMMEDRIFSHLSMTAEERYNLFFENNSELFNQIPLQFIASMLGMTPETFSRIRKK